MDASEAEGLLGLARHLRAIRAPRNPPASGACIWAQPCDLLGGSHQIEAKWTPVSLEVRRIFSDPTWPASEAWSLTAKAAGGGRWALCDRQGVLFEGVSSLKDALKRVRDEIKGVGVWAVLIPAPAARRPGP